MQKINRRFCVVIMVWLVATLLSCTSESEPGLDWITDEYGIFYTHSLAKAEKEIPFSFAYPKYLPSDLTNRPHIRGSLVDEAPDGRLFIELSYQRVADSTLESYVGIIARNYTSMPLSPELNSGYRNLDINGVPVSQAFSTSTDKTYWFNNLSGLDNARIGCGNWNNGGNATFFDGKIDKVWIYEPDALTRLQIQDHYRKSLRGLH